MIKTFILIMVLQRYNSLTTVQMEFDNLSACDNALKTVKNQLEVTPHGADIMYIRSATCVEKFKE